MEKYLPIKELSLKGYELTLNALEGNVEDGRYELENGAYAFITSYLTKELEEGLYEAHKAFTDVQVVLMGEEIMGVMSLEQMHQGECVKPYEFDIELYKADGGTLKRVGEGEYMIFTPNDAHMPGVSEAPTEMRKLVLKIPYRG